MPISDAQIQALRDEVALHARAIELTVTQWKEAKESGAAEPGQVYGRQMTIQAWQLHETVQQLEYATGGDPGRAQLHGEIEAALDAYLKSLGTTDTPVTAKDLNDARHAVLYTGAAIVGGKAADAFGGPPVTKSTDSGRISVTGDYYSDTYDDTYGMTTVEVHDLTIIISGPTRSVRLHADLTARTARALAVALDDAVSRALSSE